MPDPKDPKDGGTPPEGGNDPQNPTNPPADPPQDPKPGEGDDPKPGEGQEMVPKSQMDKVWARFKDLEGKYNDVVEEKRKSEEEKLKDNEQFKELADKRAEELKIASEKAEKAEKQFEDINNIWSDLEATIPEDRRSLVPESLSPIDKIKYVNANRAFLTGSEKPNIGSPTPKGDGNPNLDDIDSKKKRLEELKEKVRDGKNLNWEEQKEIRTLGREISENK